MTYYNPPSVAKKKKIQANSPVDCNIVFGLLLAKRMVQAIYEVHPLFLLQSDLQESGVEDASLFCDESHVYQTPIFHNGCHFTDVWLYAPG